MQIALSPISILTLPESWIIIFLRTKSRKLFREEVNMCLVTSVCQVTDVALFWTFSWLFFQTGEPRNSRNGNWRERQRWRVSPACRWWRRGVGSRRIRQPKVWREQGLWSEVFSLLSLLLWVYPVSICVYNHVHCLPRLAYSIARYVFWNELIFWVNLGRF